MTDAARGALSHSLSQPGGMDRSPPGTPRKGGKMLAFRVQMLDDSVTIFQVQAKALGRVLFDQVCLQLNLLEADYFGLEYQEVGGTKYWLDLEKPLSQQIGLSLVDTVLRFCVKFYTPDPAQLEEEFTRYLFCLQIKRDLAQGLLQCNDNTAALMASYIVQSECGDYVAEDYPDHRYLSSYKFVPNQDQELERRIMENHKKHCGQSPAEADLNLLETARRCELYGIKMHPAKDHEGVPLNLAVAHMGLLVFQNYTKINTFSWAKIRKVSFKRKKFLVKLHTEGYGYYKDVVEFFFEGRNECKNFWKKVVENHGFFRCAQVKKLPRHKTRVLSRGSSFRYSGRTQKQMIEFVRENYLKRQNFQRSQSFRDSSSVHSTVASVGASISAHPLLPLGENAVAGTPASLSCGSMTLTSSPQHVVDTHAVSPSPPLTTSLSPGTSVTSSPQHFYPQETQTRRTGPQKAPLHTTSCQSPSIVATTTAVINHSANPSSCPDYVNDVYSNSYESIRNVRSPAEAKRVYSRSFPGDEILGSNEDISHDSYEVLDEGRTDDRSRSCSWDSEKARSPDCDFRSLDRRKVNKTDGKKRRRSREFEEDGRRYTRSREEVFVMDSEEELLKEEQRKRRSRRSEREERFHEGIPERERRRPNNFDEIKYERVVANQFGKYSEFLSQEELIRQEQKVVQNYEKVCQVGKIAKELEESEKAARFKEFDAKISSPKSRAPVERTKSDPFESRNLRRNVLMHQKTIDITPQDSGTSDYEDFGRKTSKSEHDIPYTLHKRHCMNGTAKKNGTKSPRSRSISPGKRSTPVEIINMDDDTNFIHIVERLPKPVIAKKPIKDPVEEAVAAEPLYAKINKTKKTPPEPPKRTTSAMKKTPPEPPKRTTSVPSPEPDMSLPPTPSEPKNVSNGELPEKEVSKFNFPPSAVLQKREESLLLFARTRLGLSEGSAFAPVTRQGHVLSPTSQRRAKSLDAPVVSVHHLPHADAFSSKDDTIDDIVISKQEESDHDIDDFKEIVETKSKITLPVIEEKVLDPVRNKRLLSKIDSVDAIESEKETEPVEPKISDLPVSVRFPMSGQTSEESDVWEEVKVKRRTPRRSTGREDPEPKESVVWDSKDGDDDVWDDNAVFIPDVATGMEFIKRGSCGQSIDDDNRSTPVKESSPEHWVSVDDLPEAIEREERMLREQEKILREKILHEKLKRELNLDTIEVDDRIFDHSFDDVPLPVMPSEKFKGHSLDTYELTEKKLRERCAVKNPSLDEHLFQEEPLKNYISLDFSDKSSSYENVPKLGKDERALKPPKAFVECGGGNVKEIDEFCAESDLEEFVVVLDEGNRWTREESKETSIISVPEEFKTDRSISKEESIISVPDEFKDVNVGVEIRFDDDPRLSPGSRRSSEDPRFDDSGRLSPYDLSSRRTSEDPRLEESGRLSPYDTSSRRSSGDPRPSEDDLRRLSMSEDSRKCSISEDSRRFSTSISEDTRRRLSSTDETRRKRASLTKQCSVGVDSLSDEMIPGIQECSSSFEQDDKEVFEAAPVVEVEQVVTQVLEEPPLDDNHLAPPKTERELSRETEDSLDYGEGDFKDIRETVKEGEGCDESRSSKLPSSFEKSESSEGDELRYIDDKRGSTPEIIVGKSKASSVISTVIVNEGMSVIDDLRKQRAMTLPHASSSSDSNPEQRHTLPKIDHRKLRIDPDVSQDSDSDICVLSVMSRIHSQIARRYLAETGRCLRRETPVVEHEGQKRDSGEEISSSSSNPPQPRRELSSTWRPFLLESSGSSSLEEGWLPPDDNAHFADEEETSSTSNQQDDSIHEDVEGYQGLSNAEMLVGGYTSVFALSRTLSRISERSTASEHSEEDVTKPSTHSASADESIISSDHQPSLSSDPPSPKNEPFDDVIPPPLPQDDWPSPPPTISHVETFYLEIQPEEAYKVTVDSQHSSSDENQTLHEEPVHISSDNVSTATTTTQDGTVVIPVRPRSPGRETPVSKVRSPTTHFQFFEKKKKKPTTPYYSRIIDDDTGSLDRKIKAGRKCCSYYSVARIAPEEDSSSNEAVASNTIPRVARKRQRRHRVAMDLQICDGKIIAKSQEDRTSPRQTRRKPSRRQTDV